MTYKSLPAAVRGSIWTVVSGLLLSGLLAAANAVETKAHHNASIDSLRSDIRVQEKVHDAKLDRILDAVCEGKEQSRVCR